eukprot:CAMPEP_0175478298 /NCGR_PEP_ID=MMETSP0095-20121207/76861_1 /TAXON_ID=311494 /ORGANISM="Alexandrium monilatum, Strain CCMP3105" /LENGTH=62 /DNA_ID=CAMNT_0016779893 /DNA_START=190 /DNA_END=375 /DNA_ORIENTATION=-
MRNGIPLPGHAGQGAPGAEPLPEGAGEGRVPHPRRLEAVGLEDAVAPGMQRHRRKGGQGSAQ